MPRIVQLMAVGTALRENFDKLGLLLAGVGNVGMRTQFIPPQSAPVRPRTHSRLPDFGLSPTLKWPAYRRLRSRPVIEGSKQGG